jgi:hypothetical protein
MVFRLAMTNTASLNVAKKQMYHANAAIIGTPCRRGRSRERVSEKLDKNDSWRPSFLERLWPHPACQMTRAIDVVERRVIVLLQDDKRLLVAGRPC